LGPVDHGDRTELKSGADSTLNEDEALALLQRRDLSCEVIGRITKSSAAMKSRKVQLAVAQHPKTPRHVSLPLLRHLFTFELMQVTLNPVALADIKKAAEDALLHRLETISLGERVALALRSSGNVAGELLFDSELRVLQAALENPRLTEAGVVKVLLSPGASALLVQVVCEHPRWSLRKDVRIALLRSQNTPVARAAEFARTLAAGLVAEILESSNLREDVKALVQGKIEGHAR